MNHIASRFASRDVETRPPTRRALAKQATRDKVLQAAKRLFMARGYEAATIRDIAAEAGMSTGAVFANFTDKTDLFHAVLEADLQVHMEIVRGLATHPGPIEAGLTELFAAGYKIHMAQLPLLQAATSLSWTQGLSGDSGDRPTVKAVLNLVLQLLQSAQARGELAEDMDAQLTAEMLWDSYLANYRRALFDGWTVDLLNNRFARQVQVILAGVRLKKA